MLVHELVGLLQQVIQGDRMWRPGVGRPDRQRDGEPQVRRGRLAVETQAAYYDRPVTAFATYQRVLCNKCHAKD